MPQTQWVSFGVAITGAIVGILLRWGFEVLRERRRFKKELRDNNYIDVSGDWCAAWQTCVDNEELLNTEALRMNQKGQTVKVWNTERSPENPKGGYFWESQMQFFQGRYLLGWYLPRRSENNSSKGVMFLSYHAPKKVFYGKWVGAAYDGDLANGFVVIMKDRQAALDELQRVIDLHHDRVNVVFSVLR